MNAVSAILEGGPRGGELRWLQGDRAGPPDMIRFAVLPGPVSAVRWPNDSPANIRISHLIYQRSHFDIQRQGWVYKYRGEEWEVDEAVPLSRD